MRTNIILLSVFCSALIILGCEKEQGVVGSLEGNTGDLENLIITYVTESESPSGQYEVHVTPYSEWDKSQGILDQTQFVQKGSNTPTEANPSLSLRSSNKVDICHYSKSDGNWHVINVSTNAVSAHLAHGDAVDMDGDGFFDRENGCSDIDCDGDTEYNPENICSCVEGEIEIACTNFCSGYSYIGHPDDILDTGINWYEAKAICDALDTDDCDWRLPSALEIMNAAANNAIPFGVWYWAEGEVNPYGTVNVTSNPGGYGSTWTNYDPNMTTTPLGQAINCWCVRDVDPE